VILTLKCCCLSLILKKFQKKSCVSAEANFVGSAVYWYVTECTLLKSLPYPTHLAHIQTYISYSYLTPTVLQGTSPPPPILPSLPPITSRCLPCPFSQPVAPFQNIASFRLWCSDRRLRNPTIIISTERVVKNKATCRGQEDVVLRDVGRPTTSFR